MNKPTPEPREGSAPVKQDAISRSNSEPQGRDFWDEVKPLLESKLDPKHVHKPSGGLGPKGDYIQGWHAIAEANRVFGYGGWSYTINLIRDDLREVDTQKGKQWQAAYTCICTVHVNGVTRQDVGFGSGFAKNIGDAVEGATKESATDALKRALRTFGNIFGLALYDTTRVNVGVDAPTNHASEGLAQAWEDGILDALPPDPSPETLAEGYAETMLAEIEAYKQHRALKSYYNRHKEHLAFVEKHLPKAYASLTSAFSRKNKELTEKEPK